MAVRSYPVAAAAELLAWHRDAVQDDPGAVAALEEHMAALGYVFHVLTRLGDEAQDQILREEDPPLGFARQAEVAQTLRTWLDTADQLLEKAERMTRDGRPVSGVPRFRDTVVAARATLADGSFMLTPNDLARLRRAEAEQWAETAGADGEFVEDVIRELQTPHP
jgi:hypothetical protein